jgi:hypothetical protein
VRSIQRHGRETITNRNALPDVEPPDMKSPIPAVHLKPYRCRFDFEAGYLIQSPCRLCEERGGFPGCIDTCGALSDIQSLLVDTVSCARSR